MTAKYPVQSPPKFQFRYYLFTQCVGWGIFLVLRVAVTLVYCAKHPEIDQTLAVSWECLDHLAQATASHLIWKWLHWRRLFDRGWKRLIVEGYMMALGLSVLISLGGLHACESVYAADFERAGVWAMGFFLTIQHALVTVLWFSGLCALYYFQRSGALERQRAEATAAAREAQLNALKGQINPHFLFNSFNSLRALIDEDPAAARSAVTHLAVIMRYSLSSAERRLVPLSEELRVVSLYLELEKLRLGDRLAISAEVEPNLDTVLIPPLMLQGMVENAVKFGPAARKQGGDVAYRVRREGRVLRLSVSNPGRLATETDSTGTGLRNLRDRLALMYGEDAAFSLEETGDRVVAELRLPVAPE